MCKRIMTEKIKQHTARKRTVLYLVHRSLNAKMDVLNDFELPVYYHGILKEHYIVRNSAALFDTSHLDELRITGDKAAIDLENILTCRVGDMKIGQCRLAYICNEVGGTIDNPLLFRIAVNKFFMVVNCAVKPLVFNWIKEHVSEGTSVTDISHITAKIDLQGPKSPLILSKLIGPTMKNLDYCHFVYDYYEATKILISRTGYTGEIGYEIFCPHDIAVDLWHDCMSLGARPAGFGCLDILRIEMGIPAYGHEIIPNRIPANTAFFQAISPNKKCIGYSIINNPEIVTSKLVGLLFENRQKAEQGDLVMSHATKEVIGTITSSIYSPLVQSAIALGYVKNDYVNPETELIVKTKKNKFKAQVIELPFYKKTNYKSTVA